MAFGDLDDADSRRGNLTHERASRSEHVDRLRFYIHHQDVTEFSPPSATTGMKQGI